MLYSTPDELLAFLRTGQLASRSREPLPDILSDPALIGMSRTDLAVLVDRLALRQATRVERRRHQQRGGPRQPGTALPSHGVQLRRTGQRTVYPARDAGTAVNARIRQAVTVVGTTRTSGMSRGASTWRCPLSPEVSPGR